jgi:hypothetical protein
METAIVVVLGLVVLLGVVFAAFVVVTLLDAAFNNFNDLEYDDADDLFDEEHRVRPLLGVVHPKEK